MGLDVCHGRTWLTGHPRRTASSAGRRIDRFAVRRFDPGRRRSPRMKHDALLGRLVGVSALVALLLASTGAAAAPPVEQPSIFAPVSTPAFVIREVSLLVLGLSAVIYFVFLGFGGYAVVRLYRM